MARRRAHDERPERVRLVDRSELGERASAEAGVSHPGEAVVPVTRAAQRLGQGRRRRRHDRARGLVGERLERQTRPPSSGLVVASQCERLGPLAPPAHRLVERCIQRRGVGLVGSLVRVDHLRGAVGQRQMPTVAGSQREAHRQLVFGVLLELLVAPHDQPVVAADRAEQAVAVAPDPRPDLAVIEPRRDPDLHVDRAAGGFQHPDEPRSPLTVARDRKEVIQRGVSAASLERRLQHQRVVDVAPAARPTLPAWRDRAVAAPFAVQQACERGPGVKSRQAAPVDRSLPRDERRCPAVADQAVVGDRGITVVLRRHHSPLPAFVCRQVNGTSLRFLHRCRVAP